MAGLPEKDLVDTGGISGMIAPRPFVIRRIERDTADTFTLRLKSGSDRNGLHFEPGQFNMLYVFGVGEVPLSISGDPAKPQFLVHTTRVVGPVTGALHRLKTGDMVGIRGPFGKGWPVDEAEGNDIVVIAGGIGLAPLRPALYHLLAHRKKYGRIVLLYGARTPADILYRRELEKWRARFDLEVEVTVDRGDESWWGNVGVVTTLVPRSPFDPLNAVALICGPEVMMRFAVMALRKKGMNIDDIYVSMERNMKCGVGLCGHCQFGPKFVCKNGPVFSYETLKNLFNKREI
ncbi:MAG: FAD/NAD(P)-binding protein [Candidatus Zixiibacteriota bacterium]|nr:MAG: FAD/NAD(P)-binding protein [candidate division Zixibacteria bacterium]